MRYAIYCNTPYQILSAEAFISSYFDKNSDICDMYIDVDNSANMREYYNRIKTNLIINNVYPVRRVESSLHGLKKIGFKLVEHIYPTVALNMSLENKVNLKEKKYDLIMVAVPGIVARWFIYTFKNAKVSFFDDGLGSYQNDISVYYGTKIRKLEDFLFGRKKIQADKYYLFCPKYYEGIYKDKVEPLLDCSFEEFIKKNGIQSIFNDGVSELYSKKRFIYFGQPFGGDPQKEENEIIEDKVIELLNTYNADKENDVFVRPHPRSMDIDYKNLIVDKEKSFWETSCIGKISDRSVLISAFSTTMFTPKLLYDKEPFLIFTYKLYKYETVKKQNLDILCGRIKDFYKDSTKVYFPENFDELNEIILGLKKV